MLKKILNLDGAKELNQNEKKSIKGGKLQCISPLTNECTEYGVQCAEEKCRKLPL